MPASSSTTTPAKGDKADALFEICFPSHITRIPVCRPGSTIAGTVVLKLTTPMVASHLKLRFYGVERVRRSPVATHLMPAAAPATLKYSGAAPPTKRQHQSMMTPGVVLDKTFFDRSLTLWGDAHTRTLKLIPSDSVHRFHFSFTMPYVNMPTPRQTPDIEISYSLEARLYSEVFDTERQTASVSDVLSTPVKSFYFEPVIHPVAHTARPHETRVAMRDERNKPQFDVHAIHASREFVPGEPVDVVLVAPANKKITAASVQLKETTRCRTSSAPIIDASDVPTLWTYSLDVGDALPAAFAKLSKASADLGSVGRFVFTGPESRARVPTAHCASGKSADPEQAGGPGESHEAVQRARTRSLRGPDVQLGEIAYGRARHAKSMSSTGSDDTASEHSSLSDAMSVRYVPAKALSTIHQSLARASTYVDSSSKKSAAAGFTHVPLSAVIGTSGAVKCARLKVALPQLKDLSPVSSVFLDHEYVVELSMTVGGSFGSTKRLTGRFPLDIVTTRAVAPAIKSTPATNDSSTTVTGLARSCESVCDSMSCLNLSIAHSDDPTASGEYEGARVVRESELVGGRYPCLLSFLQEGERIPMPELEVIDLGNMTM